VRLSVEMGYPWSGEVDVIVEESHDQRWTMSVRVPPWTSASETVRTRTWAAGDRVPVRFEMPARVTRPDPRIDAVRGTVALERGPLVYCLEGADLPAGAELEEIAVAADVRPEAADRSDVGSGVVGLRLAATRRRDARTPIDIGAVPYFSWANRGAAAMRVWIPVAEGEADVRD
jgi:hypothetical protein